MKQTKRKIPIKTPITYYGGKQSLLKYILPLIPEHTHYVEPFFGGGAVFFAKPKSTCETINDLRGDVVNFYKVMQSDFGILRQMILCTAHSRQVHRKSAFILKYPEQHNEIEKAWAFWVNTNMSFASCMFGGWAYETKSHRTAATVHNKKRNFTEYLRQRIEKVQIECGDALQVIKSRDREDAFFYIDPPYFNADMGHYKGYTEEDFKNLLDVLSKIKGKFLLSSYPSAMLDKYLLKHGWNQHNINKKIAVSLRVTKSKTEVLTANYDISGLTPHPFGEGVKPSKKILVAA